MDDIKENSIRRKTNIHHRVLSCLVYFPFDGVHVTYCFLICFVALVLSGLKANSIPYSPPR